MYFIDVTVAVNPYLNVFDSHRITEVIEHTVMRENRFCHVFVHIEPYIEESPPKNENKSPTL